MKTQYLGDSYDVVKRLWHEILAEWAPLYTNPRFVPEDIRHAFTSFTGIRMLSGKMPAHYSVLNDPDTGIRLPGRGNQAESRRHIALSTIREQLRDRSVRCVVTFDQAIHRERGLKRRSQLTAKLKWLQNESTYSFYYESHAPFLFAFLDVRSMRRARSLLYQAGVPEQVILSLGPVRKR